MEQYQVKGDTSMNRKVDRTMIYIALSVVFMVIAIAATSFINNRAASGTDIRARASVQTGLEYQGTVVSADPTNRTVSLENLKPVNTGMALAGTWTANIPSDLSMDGLTGGVRVQIIVDSQTFSIQNRSMGVKKIDIK
jgi:hypothetical protein